MCGLQILVGLIVTILSFAIPNTVFARPLSVHQVPTTTTDASAYDLYAKLKTMYEVSTEAFNLEKHIIADIKTPALFSGCAQAFPDGKTETVQDIEMVAIYLSATIKNGNGPLDPPQVSKYSSVIDKNTIKQYVNAGAVFNDGTLNVDNVQLVVWSDDSTGCGEDMAGLDVVRFSRSGISKDNQSYYVQAHCRDGRVFLRNSIKMSGKYAVAMQTWPLIKDSKPTFEYCWKQ